MPVGITADIQLKLTENENGSGLQSGSISWLVAGMVLRVPSKSKWGKKSECWML